MRDDTFVGLSVHPTPKKSVVLLDDEPTYTSLMTQLLTDHFECRILAYTRPLDALAALPDADPGVIITDYRMPQMNGVEFIGHARKLAPGVPFILVTGHTAGMLSRDDLAKVPGLKSVLMKPFGWQQLADEIVRLWPEPNVALMRGTEHPTSI